MASNHQPSLIITGGGTGGHIYCGVAIADAWREKYPESSILFIGAKGRIEEKLVPKAGYTLETLNLGALNGVSLITRIKTLIQIPFTMLKAARLMRKIKPAAIVGVGGYSSGPTLLVAYILKCLSLGKNKTKLAFIEQNAVPGMTNRYLSRIIKTIFVAFDGIQKYFPSAQVYFVGNPIRKEIKAHALTQTEVFTIFIFGGSQGAHGINTMVMSSLPLLQSLEQEIQFIHQTGEKDYERVLGEYSKYKFKFRVEKFIYDMPACYEKSQLIISRSGSSSLSEIAAVARPSILIPFPQAADNHQEKNARLFEESGAALILKQDPKNSDQLARMILELKANPSTLLRMAEQSHKQFKSHAAESIVTLLETKT